LTVGNTSRFEVGDRSWDHTMSKNKTTTKKCFTASS